MGRHKNPQYNRKRLVVAGVAAVTTIGVAVGIGIYGSAFADQTEPAAASQDCLPAPPKASAPPETTTTDAPPSETAPPETTTDSQPPDTTTDSPTDTATDTPTDTATDSQPPDTSTSADAPTSDAPNYWSSDQLLALNGHGDGRDGRGGNHHRPTSTPTTTPSNAPGDEGGPAPSETAPTVPPSSAMQSFPGGSACEDQFGPSPQDFVDIRNVRPSNLAQGTRPGRGASTGTFNVNCGRNQNGHNNSANMIAAPGNENGAQHTHDYVGNLTTDGFSTNESLAAGGTTCTDGDKSAYFWPIIRVRNPGSTAVDPLNAHNVGDPLLPTSATIQFRGNARGPVVAAPQFLRILTGNAKSVSQAGAFQNAKWTCTGFENRITTKYPLCPRGSQLERIDDFPGCNDGNTDSANHRDHIAFADAQGNCPAGFQAIPQLRITLKWNVPRGKVFALDAFPAELHSPITAHDDFVNVMGDQLMNQVVRCINSGRRC